jgi:hypothetical protein
MINTQQNTKQEINFKNNFDKVISELNNLDKKHYCLQYFERGMRKGQFIQIERLLSKQSVRCSTHTNLFGILDITKDNINYRLNTKVGRVRLYDIKNGIEILHMRFKMSDNRKYRYGTYDEDKQYLRNWNTLKDLKDSCKMNGIKGYSKFDKLKVVQALMKL